MFCNTTAATGLRGFKYKPGYLEIVKIQMKAVLFYADKGEGAKGTKRQKKKAAGTTENQYF